MNKFWIVTLLLLVNLSAFAQGKYNFHEVKPGETKYGISKEYNISIEELERFNPDIKDGLKEGMNLLIPKASQKTGESANTAKPALPKTEVDSGKKVIHKVKPGETVYSLSNTYGITITELNEANPQIAEGLKAGMELTIPSPKSQVQPLEETMSIPPDNPDFNYHKVIPGETAYSLSKEYEIALDSLYLFNPTAEDGILIGQVLKFPKKKKTKVYNVAGYGFPKLDSSKTSVVGPKPLNEEQDTTQVTVIESPEEDDTTKGKPVLLYKIKSGDTFYSLKRKFKVDKKELREYNPEMSDTLKEGKYIILPKKENSEAVLFLDQLFDKVDNTNPSRKDRKDLEYAEKHYGQLARAKFPKEKEAASGSLTKVELREVKPDFDKEYLVGVMLPFFADADTTIEVEKRSVYALDFYNGFVMAADSMAKQGMKLNLKVTDTKNSMFKLKEERYSMQTTNYDLVVGPLYKENVEFVAQVLQAKNTPVISPLSKSVSVAGHPNLIQAVPSDESYSSITADYINRNFNLAKIIFTHTGTAEDRAKVTQIKSMLNPRHNNDFVSTVVASDGQVSVNDLRDELDGAIEHVFILVNDNMVFATDVINKLRRLREPSIHVMGSSKLLESPTLSSEDLDRLHLVMPDVNYTNYNSESTKRFVNNYRARFNADPSRFAHQGFDVGIYFLNNLYKYGPFFYSAISTFNKEETAMGFKIEKQNNGGYLNQNVFMTGIKSMELVRLL